jgi:chromosome segregation ATPase
LFAGKIVYLVTMYLSRKEGDLRMEKSKEVKPNSLLEERTKRLERNLDNWVTSVFRCTEKCEKLEEQIAELQDEVGKIKDLLRSWL